MTYVSNKPVFRLVPTTDIYVKNSKTNNFPWAAENKRAVFKQY